MIRKYITPVLLVFALFALNGSEFLHHHDELNTQHTNDDCRACILNKTLNSALTNVTFVQSGLDHSFIEFLIIETEFSLQNYNPSLPGRSPPPVSHI
jgi:hypothetical protein